MKTKLLTAASALFLFCACNNTTDKSTAASDSSTVTMDRKEPVTDTSGMNTNTGSGMVTPVNDMDKQFVIKVGMGNSAEIIYGKLASEKAASEGVKDFGNMMAMDHSDAQNKLKSIAASLSLTVPDSADAAHTTVQKKLESLSGAKFDKEYIAGQVKDHKETIALFEKEINTGSNAQIKSFANATLPTIKMHLEKIMAFNK